MVITDEPLLATFRTPGRCEWCKKPCKRREPAHIFGKGCGGGMRLDIRLNLVSLGSTLGMNCFCHCQNHNGNEPTRSDLLAIVAARENTLQYVIEGTIMILRRLPKHPSIEDMERILADEESACVRASVREVFMKWKGIT